MPHQARSLCTRAVVLFWFLAVPLHTVANLEGDALHAFKVSLKDPFNILQSWDPSLVNPCTWFHVTCNPDNFVVRIDLGNASLSGPLVAELGSLSSLEYLELFNNQINGNIPVELGNLNNLASLDLYRNAITGTIPDSLGNLRNLKYLRMDQNDLSGEIPQEITTIPNLLVVDLSYNNLSGVAPKFSSAVSTFFEGNPNLLT